jgi:xanthine dehydrogenase iron-sulfur cluster and FAD-binding subunit A
MPPAFGAGPRKADPDMWAEYFTPSSIDETLALLADHGGRARIVAGATDLILELERGQRPSVEVLIDITRIPGLDAIRLDPDGMIHLGPLVTHNHCAGSQLIIERAFALARACWEVGAPQIRNRATVAGNLITASPANDSITPLMALGAHLRFRSTRGERVVMLSDFYTGVRRNVMEADELLVDIAFPAPATGTRSSFYKLALRRAQAISVVNAAVVLEFAADRIERATVTLGSVAPTIVHAEEAERILTGSRLSEEILLSAAQAAAQAARPIDDLRGSAGYRTEMVRVSTERILRALAGGEERQGYPRQPVMLRREGTWHWDRPLKAASAHRQGTPIVTKINGRRYELETGFNKTLLRLLREDAGLTGTKEGCAEGECGACTVFLDGVSVMACMVPAPRAHAAEIVTVEGLAHDGQLHPIQQAFIDEGAVQCGYCTPGFLMSGAMLLEEASNPTKWDIQQALTGNLCRCTGYYKIISAFERAAKADRRETVSAEPAQPTGTEAA